MCMFSAPIEHVSGTRIYARMLDGPPARQVLIYAMTLATAVDVAMILPVPTAVGAGEQALRFVSLEGYADLFDRLDAAFPSPWPQPEALRHGGLPEQTAMFELLEVHRVGAFDASFVPDRAAFSRLDPRFRLSDELLAALPYADDWGYAVFVLRGSESREVAPSGWWARLRARLGSSVQPHTVREDIHPMAFVFETRTPNQLFFPTIHVHHGQLPREAGFDHQLYFQLEPDAGRDAFELPDGLVPTDFGPPGVALDRASSGLPKHVDIARTHELLDAEGGAYRLTVVGPRPNRDIEVQLARSVR